jgi:DinB superfamily
MCGCQILCAAACSARHQLPSFDPRRLTRTGRTTVIHAGEDKPMQFQVTHGLEVLERTPAAFRALLDGLPEAWTAPNEGSDTFSAFDNLGHLIHGERTDWIPRARIILAQGPNRRFEPYDRFAQYHESRGKSVAELLDEFAQLRAENVATLRSWQLSDRELALEGKHPDLGTVTLRQLLATWVAHDLGHIAQTARVMAKQYREAVGPWRTYLPVLGV